MRKKIYHRNDARPALINMSLSAKRLLFICLAQLDRDWSKKDNVIIKFDASKSFLIRVSDYAQLCVIDYSAAYRQMVEGVKELRGYVLEADQGLLKKRDNNLPSDAISPFTIATDGTWYSKGNGSVNIKFAKEMEPLISNLTDNFTGQFLLSAMQLPDSNVGKLYLILREWISSGYSTTRTIQVNKFKHSLGLSHFKTYHSYENFNKLFFKRTVKKLIDKTEFTEINMEILERRMRKAYKVKVNYKYDLKFIQSKNKIVDKVLGKKIYKEKYEGKKNKLSEEFLFFVIANRYLNQDEAKSLNLNWDDGLTAQEVLRKLSC
ncbi:replication initiation protein [Candidatus Photodesmus blepharus]|uniref:replication initiation protein n=1 Tax=Candidatus Photodesmus blepharonis TaxID=1179155 RepID=UPI0006990D19|nr:replication initiation protein [Candidatus Photodesmus blepharus]